MFDCDDVGVPVRVCVPVPVGVCDLDTVLVADGVGVAETGTHAPPTQYEVGCGGNNAREFVALPHGPSALMSWHVFEQQPVPKYLPVNSSGTSSFGSVTFASTHPGIELIVCS